MLEKLRRLAYRHTDGMFGLYLKHVFVKSFTASAVIELAIVLYIFIALLESSLLFYLFAWVPLGVYPWWFVAISGVLTGSAFMHATVLCYRISHACSGYKLAWFNVIRTEGPPKPFNLDQY